MTGSLPAIIGALSLVAMHAGQSQILQVGLAPVLTGQNVVNLQRMEIPGARHMAILAPSLCSIPNVSDKVWIHELQLPSEGSNPAFLSATRDRECMTAKTFATLT